MIQTVSKETTIVSVILALIIFATAVGFYDRTVSKGVGSTAVRVLPKASVMVISLSGVITADGSDWRPSPVDTLLHDLEEAEKAKSVKAIVLRINSPGGTVGASQEIFDAVMRFKKNTSKPVVASIMDVGASGAYWSALSADYIMAHSGSMVGSVGVITQTMDLTDVPEKYGINVRTMKAGRYKDILNPWRDMRHDETNIIQEMLDDVHQQFKLVLIEQRNFDESRADKVANGQIFSGNLALKNGLIDSVGSLHDAIQYAGKLANIEDPNVVVPSQGLTYWMNSFRAMIQPKVTLFDGWMDGKIH